MKTRMKQMLPIYKTEVDKTEDFFVAISDTM